MTASARLGVLGWPVRHSLSPAMHNAALHRLGPSGWRYQHLPIPPEAVRETIRALPAVGFRGVNVTIPHKRAALELADAATPRSRAIGAANTLVFDSGGAIQADNTDAPALLETLPVSPRGRTALVLGAGGSARAAVWALLDAGAAEVRVWSRRAEQARELAADLGALAVHSAEPADLLVHCTPLGLDGRSSDHGQMFKDLPLGADDLSRYRCVVDFVYTENGTPLAHAARERSLAVVDGLEILVAQGALAFTQFTGGSDSRAVAAVMRAAVRRA